jgi:spore maturation protein CgeB
LGLEKSRVFGEGAACLNTFPLAEGDSLNCRAFEVAGAAGLQIIEYRPAIEQCFEPGKELVSFKTYEELLGHIERAISHPQEMLPIRKAAAKRALAEHTYRHRLDVILAGI